MTKKSELISVPTIAKRFGKDSSQVRKDIQREKLPVFEAITSEGKSCTAITYKDFEMLAQTSAYQHKIFDELPAGAVTLEDASKLLQRDKSGLQKITKELGMVLEKAKLSEGARPVRFLSAKQFKDLEKRCPSKVIAD